MFLDIGFSHREAVYVVYTIQIALVLSAFLLRYATDELVLIVYLGFCITLLSMIALAKHRIGATSMWVIGSQRFLAKMGIDSELGIYRKFSYQTIRVTLSAIFLIGVSSIANIPRDFGVMAIVLLIMLLPTLLIINEFTNTIRRLTLYVTAGFIVYFIELAQQDGRIVANYLPVLFLIVGVLVAFLIRMAGSSVREFSALDFLLLATAVIVSLFPEAKVMDGIDAKVVIEIVVLFYAIDVLFNRRDRLEKFVLASTSVALVVIVLKSLL